MDNYNRHLKSDLHKETESKSNKDKMVIPLRITNNEPDNRNSSIKHSIDLENNSISKIKNNVKLHICSGCNEEFAYASGLSKHKKSRCIVLKNDKEKNILENKVKELEEREKDHIKKQEGLAALIEKKNEEMNEILKKRAEELLNKNRILEEQLVEERKSKDKLTNNVLSHASSVVNTTIKMNALSYANKHYYNAPVLKIFDDPTALDVEDEQFTSAEVYMLQYRKGTLIEYLSNIITKYHSAKDKRKQSLWSVDIERRNYITRNKVDNKNQWTRDNKGNKIKKIIIKPFVKNLEKIINLHYLTLNDTNIDFPCDKTEYIKSVLQLLDDINKEKITNELIRVMTPNFHLSSKDLVVRK